MENSIPWALTYDDVLIVPKRSSFVSRSEASTRTRLTKKISINVPIVSANMDTVTEAEMAIALARIGGFGFLHRFMSIEENVEQVKRVKRAQNFIVEDPYTIAPNCTVREARKYASEVGVTGLLVANGDHRLRGMLTQRSFMFVDGDEDVLLVQDIMTPKEKMVIASSQTTFEEAKKIFADCKIDKLPLINDDGVITGLITLSDIKHVMQYPLANLDSDGQLLVGGSVGVHGDFIERATALVNAGADALVIDIAHGHSDLMIRAIEQIRAAVGDAQIVAGNIATATAARDLCEAGVDAVKVGVGPGTTCITRLVTGCGMPQLTAVMEVARVAKRYGVPVIADGGVRRSGDIVKAIGAGADTIMSGGMLAGTEESPGVLMKRGDKKFKLCRGSASFSVSHKRKSINLEKKDLSDVVPEGVESLVPYKGPVIDLVSQWVGGLKSGMSYTNSHTIAELQENVSFVRLTAAGQHESGAHDIDVMG